MSGGTPAPHPTLALLALLPVDARERMVGLYVESLRGQLAQIDALLAAGEEPCELVHKLAGSAAMMQDAALSLPARALEHALRDGELAQAQALWPQVQAAAQATLVVLAG